MACTLVIGDVHGCADELDALLEVAAPTRVVFVGDLFTKGPFGPRVYARIRALDASAVLGNHDARLLSVIDGERPDDAHGREIIAVMDAEDPSWRDWTRALPLFLPLGDFVVVHAGLHPSGDLARTPRKMAINVRRLPDDDDPDNPFWWQRYEGASGVIFGHDAVRGLIRVDRPGLPPLIGLDSGCCYGGALSGYLLEEDRVVSVPARRAYRPVGRI